MKVVLINSRLRHFGGLETRLLNYINYFSERGHEIYVLAYKIDKNITLPKNTRIVKLNIRWIPKRYRRKLFDSAVGRYMANNKFDFSLSLGRTSHQDAVLAPSNHKGYIQAMGIKSVKFNDRQQILLDSLSYEKSKVIYACSDMMKKELVELYGIGPDKISILYPPLNTKKFNLSLQQNRTEYRNEYGMREQEKAFVFVSTGHKRKGLPLLLEVFSRLSNTPNTLYIAGSPNVNPPTSNIKYLGYVKDTHKLFTAADFTIHPALYEPFGQIITESLACGTPVLVSEKVGAKDILTKKTGLVINGFDPATWTDKIQSVERNKFNIPDDFIATYDLSTEEHMKKMLSIWKDI